MKQYAFYTKFLIFIVALPVVFVTKSYTQHNFLGKDQLFITNHYRLDPEFSIFIDTIKSNKILVTCKSSSTYPYYTYEIDMITDICISYGFVSKNRDVLNTYIENLDYLGKIIKTDSLLINFIYLVELPEKKIYYSVKQPFADSNIITRKDLFYILITEEKKNNNKIK